MYRSRNLFGPNFTFLGVPSCDWPEPATYADADVVILGAPFDGGTSHRPGTRFGPSVLRGTDYLPHDGSRPHMAMRVDALDRRSDRDGRRRRRGLQRRGAAQLRRDRGGGRVRSPANGAIPLILGGDHTVTWPDVTGVARHHGVGRISIIHFDAHADTGDIDFGSLYGHGQPMRRLIESGAARGDRFLQIGLRGYWPEPDDAGLDGRPGDELVPHERDRRARPRRRARSGVRDRARRLRRRVPVGRHRRVRPRPRARHRYAGAGRPHRPAAARRGVPDLPRAAGRRDGHRRGVPAVRPCRDHRAARQPGRARSAGRDGPAPQGRRDRCAGIGPRRCCRAGGTPLSTDGPTPAKPPASLDGRHS